MSGHITPELWSMKCRGTPKLVMTIDIFMFISTDPQHLREFVDLCEVLPYWYNILFAVIAVPDWKVKRFSEHS